MTASTQREGELKAQLSSVQEAVQRQLAGVSDQLEETRVRLEQQEREAGSQRAELEGRVAMVTGQLDSEREDWSKSESQLKTVCTAQNHVNDQTCTASPAMYVMRKAILTVIVAVKLLGIIINSCSSYM